MALVSVIIPCYNGENYIDRCMRGLLEQTIGFKNLQIIIVNDASTDTSLEKMKHWENLYPEQILVINCEKNRRQGAARNLGINYATAKYISFLDVDDVVAPTFYKKLYSKIEEGGYDWVSTKFVHIPAGQQPDFTEPQIKNDKEYHCSEDENLVFEDFGSGTLNGNFGQLSARISNKDFIKNHQIYFPEGLVYEDNYWGVKCALFSKNIYIIDEALYCYFINENSTVTAENTGHHLDRMKIEELVLDLFKEQGLFHTYYEQIEKRFIEKYYCDTWYAIFIKMDTIPDVLPIMREKILSEFPDYKNNPYIKELPEIYHTLLMLLDSERGYTPKELEKVKEIFRQYIEECFRME